MTVLSTEFSNKWSTGPGVVPEHQTLAPLGEGMEIDADPLDGEKTVREVEEATQPAAQHN